MICLLLLHIPSSLLLTLPSCCRDKRRVQILENYTLLSTKIKSNIDKAMQSFIDMLEADKDYLPAILGMSTGFMIERSQHKARNLLKRVAKMEVRVCVSVIFDGFFNFHQFY